MDYKGAKKQGHQSPNPEYVGIGGLEATSAAITICTDPSTPT